VLTLGNRVRLDISVVVLASPDESTVGLHGIGDHIVNQAVLVPDSKSLELGGVFLFVDGLEDILKATIVTLENGVLGAQIQRPLLLDGVLHARVSKFGDGLGGKKKAMQFVSK